MAKKVLRYTEEQFVTLLENIVKKVKQQESINEDYPRKRVTNDPRITRRFGKESGSWDTPQTDYYGNVTMYTGDNGVKIACLEDGRCYEQNSNMKMSREEAAQMLGVDSLDMMGESKTKNRRLR